MRRKFEGSRFAPFPAHVQPHSPSAPPLRKTPGNSRSEGGTVINTMSESSGAVVSLKAMMGIRTLLFSRSNLTGEPPTTHPPWNKTRIEPMEKKHSGGEGLDEKQGERVGRGFERGEAEKRENKEGRDEGKGGREDMEIWWGSSKGSATNNGMRNGVGGGESIRGELPGWPSSDRSFSAHDSMLIDGIYFQTSVDASKPPPVKQKLSKTTSLISLARRLQGPARVGDIGWSEGRSWDSGENSRKIYGSIGEMSVSASVSERGTEEERKRWQLQVEDGSSEGLRKKTHKRDPETESGSKESQSEFSLSDASSITSSVTAEQESDTETVKNESDSGTEKEERESESGSQDEGGEGPESEKESGLESEDEGTGPSRKLKREIRRRERGSLSSSSGRDTYKYSGSTVSSSRPKTSSRSRSTHETIEEESEEEEESGDEHVVKSGRASSQSDVSSGATDPSEDLSPIIEDTEEEEESEEGDEGDEGLGDLENESAA